MRTSVFTTVGVAVGLWLLSTLVAMSEPQEDVFVPATEYVTIRWDGPQNTHLIRASGKVERLGAVIQKMKLPRDTDERAFYMNQAMNAVAREGYEFAGMTADEIVMRRTRGR